MWNLIAVTVVWLRRVSMSDSSNEQAFYPARFLSFCVSKGRQWKWRQAEIWEIRFPSEKRLSRWPKRSDGWLIARLTCEQIVVWIQDFRVFLAFDLGASSWIFVEFSDLQTVRDDSENYLFSKKFLQLFDFIVIPMTFLSKQLATFTAT